MMNVTCFDKIMKYTTDIIICLSLGFRITYVNKAAESFYGIKKMHMLGLNFRQLCKNKKKQFPLPKNYSQNCNASTKYSTSEGISWVITGLIEPKNNKHTGLILVGQKPTQVNDSLNLDEDELGFLKKQVEEVTGQSPDNYKTAKDYIRNIRSYYEKIISCMPNNVYWLDRNCITLGCNDNVVKFVGLKSQKEFIGIDYEKMGKLAKWDKGVAESFKKDDMQVMKTGVAIFNKEEPPIRNSDGTYSYYMSSRVPLRDIDGKVIGIVGISVDITDRKEAEKWRIKHEAMEKLTKFTNLVAGSIAHELRTPLSVINLQLDLMARSLLSNKSQKEKDNTYNIAIKASKGVIKSTAHVINDMLIKLRSFSTGEILQNNFEVIPITTDIEDCLSAYPFEKEERKLIRLKGFDSLDNRFQYIGDSVLTKHVLANLLKNSLRAIKEAGKGTITIALKVGVSKDNFNYLIFKDTGAGICEEFLPKIFEQFKTSSSHGTGSGLGLSFCKMVIENYGGNIKCKSKEGQYTEFILSFPKANQG